MTDYLDRPIRQFLKNTFRPSLTKLSTVHRPGLSPDIAILSSPRSGSTWLMETVATQPGMKFINEPDHKVLMERYRALRVAPRWLWLSLTPAERQDLARYLLDDRRSGVFGPANPFAAHHSWRTNRRVLKLIRMTALVEWLDTLGFATVYLLRHPIPQAQSCMKRSHRILLGDFLADVSFCEHLDESMIAYTRQVSAEGDPLIQYVTQWCLENIVALNSPLAGKRFAVTTHETLIANPISETERLAQALGLEYVDRLLARISEPSRTTDSSSVATVESIRIGQSARLLDLWRRDITPDEERRLLEPLSTFGITLYSPGDPMPIFPKSWLTGPDGLSRSEPHGLAV